MAEDITSSSTPPSETPGTSAAVDQRLPSTRPIDHRWDRSRGISLSNARRPLSQDYTWSHNNGIIFGSANVQTRAYATRPLAAQQIDRQESLVNNPNKLPTFNVLAPTEQAQKFVLQQKEWKAKIAELEANLAEGTKRAERLRQQVEESESERRAVVNKVRNEERVRAESRAESEMSKLKQTNAKDRQVAVTARNEARQLESKAHQLGTQVEKLHQQLEFAEQQHSKAVSSQQQMYEKQIADEVQAVMQGRQRRKESERSSYEAYRKVYKEYDSAMAQLSGQVAQVENARFAAGKFLKQHPTYTAQMVKFDPWFSRKHPKLLERLDQYLLEHCKKVEESGNAIKRLRHEQQELQESLNFSAHDTRRLMRFHRITETPNKLTMADTLSWIANEQPFRARRDGIEAEIKTVQRTIDQEKLPALVASHRQKMDVLLTSRSAINGFLAVQTKVRDREALEALLTDSLTEKEIFVATLKANMKIEEASRAWSVIVGTDPKGYEDSEVSISDQNTVRDAYVNKSGETRSLVREFEKLVRKRSILEQSLGKVSAQREAELDAVIRERITAKIVEERSAFERLGVARASRVSSFVRLSRATSPAPRVRTTMLDSTPASSRSPAASGVSKGPLKSIASRSPSMQADVRISQLRKLYAETAEGEERKAIEAEALDFRQRVKQDKSRSMEGYRARELQKAEPDHALVQRYDKEIALITNSAPVRDWLGRRVKPKRNGLPRSRARGSSSGSAKAAMGSDGATTSFQPSALNLQPTAAKQAAHMSWPAGYRYFHAEGPTSSPATADTSVGSERLLPIDPYYLPTSAERQGIDAAAGGTPSNSRTSHDMTSLSCSESSSSKGSSGDDVGIAKPAAVNQRKAVTRRETDCSEAKLSPDVLDSALTTPFSSETMEDDHVEGEATMQYKHEPEQDAESARDVESEKDIESARDVESAQDVESEEDVTLTYQIPLADYRNAVVASRSTIAAFWTYKLYKNADGKTPTLHFCTSFKQAEEQAQKFLDEPVIGFDIEWEPFAHKNKVIKEQVSLIQIASEDKIGLFQIARFVGDTVEQLMPPSLRKILESNKTIKAGVNIAGDATRMEKYLNVKMQAQFELSHLYKVVLCERKEINKKLFNLAAQVQNVLLLPLKKDDVRTSAWAKQLNMQQVEYSASDAYAGFRLFHALETKRRMMDPMPPRPAFHELHQPLVLGDGTVLVPQRRKPGKAASTADKAGEVEEEDDEEFFDAVESFDTYEVGVSEVAGVPSSGREIAYPALPQIEEAPLPILGQSEQSLRPEEETPASDKPAASASDSTKPATTSAKTLPPRPPEVEHAEAWVSSWRASLPAEYKVKCANPSLRAWHLWHEQNFDIRQVASFVRDPPLAPVTVASYILQAIKEEHLAFDAERVREALDLMPSSVLGRYHRIVEKVRSS